MLTDDVILPFDKRMALSNGFIPCSDCEHDITRHNVEVEGCETCMCDIVLSDAEIVTLMKMYEFPPYKEGIRVMWYDNPDDQGTVVYVSKRDGSVDVRWSEGVEKVNDPRRTLVVL